MSFFNLIFIIKSILVTATLGLCVLFSSHDPSLSQLGQSLFILCASFCGISIFLAKDKSKPVVTTPTLSEIKLQLEYEFKLTAADCTYLIKQLSQSENNSELLGLVKKTINDRKIKISNLFTEFKCLDLETDRALLNKFIETYTNSMDAIEACSDYSKLEVLLKKMEIATRTSTAIHLILNRKEKLSQSEDELFSLKLDH